jgi:hypothetical protein
MKFAIIAAALTVASTAHAESFFQMEAGLGYSRITNIGDGNWLQQNMAHSFVPSSPIATIGVTGEVWSRANWNVRYHVDYVYIGEYRASCDCVPDNNYNPRTHQAFNTQSVPRFSPFNGHGHLNGIAATVDAGYKVRGYRVALEGGLWAYNQSWNESLYSLADEWVYYHRGFHVQIGYVAGARIERGAFSLAYRYYNVRQDWTNGVPGLAADAHTLTFGYRF